MKYVYTRINFEDGSANFYRYTERAYKVLTSRTPFPPQYYDEWDTRQKVWKPQLFPVDFISRREIKIPKSRMTKYLIEKELEK